MSALSRPVCGRWMIGWHVMVARNTEPPRGVPHNVEGIGLSTAARTEACVLRTNSMRIHGPCGTKNVICHDHLCRVGAGEGVCD